MTFTAVHTLQAIGLAVWLFLWMANFDWYTRTWRDEQ